MEFGKSSTRYCRKCRRASTHRYVSIEEIVLVFAKLTDCHLSSDLLSYQKHKHCWCWTGQATLRKLLTISMIIPLIEGWRSRRTCNGTESQKKRIQLSQHRLLISAVMTGIPIKKIQPRRLVRTNGRFIGRGARNYIIKIVWTTCAGSRRGLRHRVDCRRHLSDIVCFWMG